MNLSQLLRPTAWRLHCATGGRIPVDDLMQEGAIAAWLRAGEHESHAVVAGRSAMVDLLRKELGRVFRPDVFQLDDDFDLIGDDSTEAAVIYRQQARIAAEEIERLPSIQRAVLADYVADVHQLETARRLKITRQRVAEILHRATKALARSVALRTADAARLRAGVPVPSMTDDLPLDILFDPSIVRGVSPSLLRASHAYY